MLRTAFSTVACPDWTLERIALAAAEYGYSGVELRSVGDGQPGAFASEPAHSSGDKVRAHFADAGVDLVGIASGVRLDAPIFPPVLGHVFPSRNAGIREGKRMVDLAHACGAPFLRVFPFEIPASPAPGIPKDSRFTALRRISDRLGALCDHARNRDVRVLIENSADFASAHDLDEIMRRVSSPQLGACYDLQAGIAAGDKPEDAAALLGDRLLMARVRDSRAGAPCQLGQGDLPVKAFLESLRLARSDAWVVFNWDRAWLPSIAPAESILPEAARLLSQWVGEAVSRTAAA